MQQYEIKGLEEMETDHINPEIKRQGKIFYWIKQNLYPICQNITKL